MVRASASRAVSAKPPQRPHLCVYVCVCVCACVCVYACVCVCVRVYCFAIANSSSPPDCTHNWAQRR